MRSLGYILATIGEVIIIALLVIFVVENMRAVRYTFLGNTFPGNVWWTVAGAALLGFLFGVLLLLPGLIASAGRRRSLRRERERNGQDLAQLRLEHERLKTQHAQVLNERNQYQARPAPAATPASTPAAAPPQQAQPAPTDGWNEAPQQDGAPQPPYPGTASRGYGAQGYGAQDGTPSQEAPRSPQQQPPPVPTH